MSQRSKGELVKTPRSFRCEAAGVHIRTRPRRSPSAWAAPSAGPVRGLSRSATATAGHMCGLREARERSCWLRPGGRAHRPLDPQHARPAYEGVDFVLRSSTTSAGAGQAFDTAGRIAFCFEDTITQAQRVLETGRQVRRLCIGVTRRARPPARLGCDGHSLRCGAMSFGRVAATSTSSGEKRRPWAPSL